MHRLILLLIVSFSFISCSKFTKKQIDSRSVALEATSGGKCAGSLEVSVSQMAQGRVKIDFKTTQIYSSMCGLKTNRLTRHTHTQLETQTHTE